MAFCFLYLCVLLGLGGFSLRWCFIEIGLGLVDIQRIALFVFLFLRVGSNPIQLGCYFEAGLLLPNLRIHSSVSHQDEAREKQHHNVMAWHI